MPFIALAQMNSVPVVKQNLAMVESFCLQAAQKGVQLLVLPENFAWMGGLEQDKMTIAESFGQGEIQNKMSELSKKFKMWLVAGSIPIKSTATRVKASCLVYDDQGNCVARYDKIHLFDVSPLGQETYQESASIEPGSEIIVVDTPLGRMGVSICYDIRFSELYRQLVIQGAEFFVIPSAFTVTTGKAHWHILCRARAIENMCYVFAPNQWGNHENGRCTYGHSLAVDPWGRILGEQKDGVGLVIADIDLAHLAQLRQQFPCNEHHII